MSVREDVLSAYKENRVGERILTYRAKHNLSQLQFAAKIGVSSQTIYSIEAKMQKPSKLTLEKIILTLEGDEKNEGQHKPSENVQSM